MYLLDSHGLVSSHAWQEKQQQSLFLMWDWLGLGRMWFLIDSLAICWELIYRMGIGYLVELQKVNCLWVKRRFSFLFPLLVLVAATPWHYIHTRSVIAQIWSIGLGSWIDKKSWSAFYNFTPSPSIFWRKFTIVCGQKLALLKDCMQGGNVWDKERKKELKLICC